VIAVLKFILHINPALLNTLLALWLLAPLTHQSQTSNEKRSLKKRETVHQNQSKVVIHPLEAPPPHPNTGFKRRRKKKGS
jgi:hypothetical protein